MQRVRWAERHGRPRWKCLRSLRPLLPLPLWATHPLSWAGGAVSLCRLSPAAVEQLGTSGEHTGEKEPWISSKLINIWIRKNSFGLYSACFLIPEIDKYLCLDFVSKHNMAESSGTWTSASGSLGSGPSTNLMYIPCTTLFMPCAPVS